MSLIPKSHPRARSLQIRERLVGGFESGIVATEGLLAQGRGEAFDYLLGERTGRHAKVAIRAAAAQLLLAKHPTISVNGNVAALCPKEIVRLAGMIGAKIEVNLFYSNEKRKRNIARVLRESGAGHVLGMDGRRSVRLSGIDSGRRTVDRDGIFAADVVVVPLEDGDRTGALRKAGKKVVAIDLNPMSRTSQDASITIVDNVTRAVILLAEYCKKMSKRSAKSLEKITDGFDNQGNISGAMVEIREHLTGRLRHV